jgi:hypothetical protein
MPTDAFEQGCGTSTDYLLSLTREEITQALGLPNDVDGERQSIFDQIGDPPEYSATDRRLIQALYCDNVRAGMTEMGLWRALVPDSTRLTELLVRAAGGTATADEVAQVQSLLIDLGYKIGRIDGVLNEAAIGAIAEARTRFLK